MATYLPNVTDSVPMPLLYQPNIQFLIQSGMYAAQRYQAVLNKMNEVYGQYAEKPILNPEVDKRRDNYIKEMQVYIDKFKNVNLLEPEVITTFTDIFKPIAKDPLIYYHMKNTEDYINERSANELLRFSPLGEVKDGKGDDYVIYDENITKSLDTMAEYMRNLSIDNPDNYRELIPKGLVSIDVDRYIWNTYKDQYKDAGRSEIYVVDNNTGKAYLFGSPEYQDAVNKGLINETTLVNVPQSGGLAGTSAGLTTGTTTSATTPAQTTTTSTLGDGWQHNKPDSGSPKGTSNFAYKTIYSGNLNNKPFEIVRGNLFYAGNTWGKNKTIFDYYKFDNLPAGIAAAYNYLNNKFKTISQSNGATVYDFTGAEPKKVTKKLNDMTYYDLLQQYIGVGEGFKARYDSALEHSTFDGEDINAIKNKKITEMSPSELLNRIIKQESGLDMVIPGVTNFDKEYSFFSNGKVNENNLKGKDVQNYITNDVLKSWNNINNINKIANNPGSIVAQKGALVFSTDGSIIKKTDAEPQTSEYRTDTNYISKEPKINDLLIGFNNRENAVLQKDLPPESQPITGGTAGTTSTKTQQVEARLGFDLIAINKRGGEEQVYSAYELTNNIMKNNPAIQTHFRTQALTKYINIWGQFGYDSGKAMQYIMDDIDNSTKELDDKLSYYGNLSYMSDMAKANIEKELKSMIADRDIYLARVSDILNATEQIKNFDNISKQTKQIANEVQKTKDAADKVKNVKVSDSSFLDVVKTLANIKGSILSHLNAFDNGKAIAMNMYKETAQTLASNVGALKPGGTGYGGSGSGGGVGDAKNIPYGPSMNGEIIIGYDNNNKAQVVPNDFSVSVGLNTYHREGHNMRNMEKDLLNNVKETLGGAGYTIELLNFNDKEHNYVSQMLKDRNTDPSTQTNVNSVGAYLYKVHITDNNNVKEETRVVTYKNQNGTMSQLSIYRVVKKPDNSNTTQQ